MQKRKGVTASNILHLQVNNQAELIFSYIFFVTLHN